MTREQAKKNLEAIAFWAEGGDLWGFDKGRFTRYGKNAELFFMSSAYIMEDQFFECRKAMALGDTVQVSSNGRDWFDKTEKTFYPNLTYRIKKKEWYEKKENVGKVVMVRDRDSDEWLVAIFTGYEEHRFKTGDVKWKQARLLTPDEVAKDET